MGQDSLAPSGNVGNNHLGSIHVPVMVEEVVEAMGPCGAGWVIDGTLGLGGPAKALLDEYPRMSLLGIEVDREAIQYSECALLRFGERARVVYGTYTEMGVLAIQTQIDEVVGAVLDLGLSSLQLSDPLKGFSFKRSGPLDMRFSGTGSLTAGKIVNSYEEKDIADIIFRFGDERRSRKIASAIVARRPLETTTQLAKVVEDCLGRGQRRIHPATRTFQALRIAVNGEIENIYHGLKEAINLLQNGGRIAVISYHSIEDRVVKNLFRDESVLCICPPELPICECHHEPRIKLVNKRVKRPSQPEVERNPSSRSAKLRVAERI